MLPLTVEQNYCNFKHYWFCHIHVLNFCYAFEKCGVTEIGTRLDNINSFYFYKNTLLSGIRFDKKFISCHCLNIIKIISLCSSFGWQRQIWLPSLAVWQICSHTWRPSLELA